ncbi:MULTISPECIES: TetR/AcrR family transcriptional regulator [unclassified Micromonospora]|uniref:TetR/AcrR family transcriptional regulator n=1 Tax=unclassified Micromonospora TaxID=2617518 RepID=UPI00332BE3DF
MKSGKRGPGRPRSFDQERVLEQATQVFWAHGYEGASLTMLQAATGLNPPSIYHAFGSKAGLYSACLDHYVAHVGHHTNAALSREVADRAGLAEFLLDAARQFTDAGRPGGCMISTAALELPPQSDSVARAVATRRDTTLGLLADYFRRAQAAGTLDPAADPRALARYFGAVVQGMSVQARDGATAGELAAVAHVALTAWQAPPG